RLAELEEAIAAEVRAARPVRWRRVAPAEMAGLRVRSRGLPAGHTGDVFEAVQASRRAWGRCLSVDGLSAGGPAQLPCAARLEPRRPGDFLERGNDRGIRSAPDRAFPRPL